MQTDLKGRLEAWYRDFITYFRSEFDSLPEEIKKIEPDNNVNFLSPCQIEVFWLREPEHQLIFKSNFKGRPDTEIMIHGPFDSHEFFDKVEPILGEARWAEDRGEEHARFPEGELTLSYAAAAQLNRMTEMAKASMFMPAIGEGHGMGHWISKRMWVEHYFGNIANTDYVERTNNMIKDIRQRAQQVRANSQDAKPVLTELPRPSSKGYGVHFFPAIYLGTKPKRTPAEILRGRMTNLMPRGVFDLPLRVRFSNYTAAVGRDGFIFLPISSKETVLRVLNVIMAIGMMKGLGFAAVREHELAEIEYDKETLQIGTTSYNPGLTMRTSLFSERMYEAVRPQERREVAEETMIQIISEAGKIFAEGKFVDEVRLLSESFTHLRDAEYSQSFIMSWSIIERHISQLWKKKLDQKDLEGGRVGKLLRRAIDYQLEVLNLAGEMDDREYDIFSDLKTKRNRFIHRGKSIDKEDAQRCFGIAQEIVKGKISIAI